MYRAFALKALRAGMLLDDCKGLEKLAAQTTIRLEPGEEDNRVLLDGEDVTGLIRNQAVTDAASQVSVYPAIRAWMVRMQQQLGAKGGMVMEGRDIGTVVFPHAQVKIYLTLLRRCGACAALTSSAQRPPIATGRSIRDLRARDERDRNRADSPLSRDGRYSAGFDPDDSQRELSKPLRQMVAEKLKKRAAGECYRLLEYGNHLLPLPPDRPDR